MLSSSLSLSAGSLFLALLASPVAAASESYSLVENWHGESFLDYFNFHVGSDPTNGFVTYLDKTSAESAGLVKVNDDGSFYIGVDHNTTLSTTDQGRDSVRIGSKKYYDHSLVIADISHMPGSICGSWPAFWSVGKNWPSDGEIDIIEGVNLQDHNEIVMHTAGTCSITDTGMTGSVNATGCGEDLGTVGCVIEGQQGSYGTSFNKQGGGVYAMQWTEQFVKIWFFPRASIPTSITKGAPDVSQFGTPMALVEDGCDVATSFKAQSFVFDITFCGDWAGGVYGQSGCPMSGSDSSQSCISYVAKNPAAFEQTYWEIKSVKIYQTGVAAKTVASTSHSTSSTHGTAAQAVTEASATQAAPETTAQTSAAVVETAASAASTSTESRAAAVTAGTVGELGSDVSSAGEQTTKSATTRYVTEFVTSTTTLCPVAEASASSSAAAVESKALAASSSDNSNVANVPATAASANSEPSSATNSVQEVQTQPAVEASAASTPVAASVSQAVSSQTSSQLTDADAASSSAPASVASTDGPLPTIIMAPGMTAASASARITSKPYQTSSANAIATAASAASGSTFQGSTSSAVSPVFTGAAEKASVKFSTIIAAFLVALMA
ncbi:endo-1-3(4)-beta-glucanase [Penicillium cataractarum]|uniref:endo-1,3(4)-beta-glucanase n=1 Tax=Penicillium cataractarum TaxID=2100454 RepID=A0A9W9S0J7_9EURO|nr:endo-1-3(4)-beta-glucanase [Penicillium cataractarum]KAJ5369695.1 endo-1-3(4)-beta-glucanase [Penicillium cataractarum]